MAEGAIGLNFGGRKASMAGRLALLAVVAIFAAAAVVALRACDNTVSTGVQPVKIGGEWFHLEVADTPPVRMKGLGQRDHIENDGGMLFVFPERQLASRGGFVMRDCPIDIDIIYLDGAGRVGNWHAMKAEPPRGANGKEEGKVGDMGGDPGSPAQNYEDRLHKYEPRYDYQFAIELKGGTIEGKLKGKFKEGDKILEPAQAEALKKRSS